MHKVIIVVFALALGLLLCSCSRPAARQSAEEEPPAEQSLLSGDATKKNAKKPRDEDKPVADWIKDLREGSKEQIITALFALKRKGPKAEAAIPALIEKLKDEDSYVQGEAASALGEIGKASVPGLLKALQDQSARSRQGAADALGFVGEDAKEAISALAGRMKDGDASVKIKAASAYYRVGGDPEASVAVLTCALADDALRREACFALGGIGSDARAAVPALIELVKEGDIFDRPLALGVLAEIGPAAKEAVPALIEALKDDDAKTRTAAVETLACIGPFAGAAAPALLETLKDPTIREKTLNAFRTIGPAAEAVTPKLIAALKSDDPGVRCAAAAALGHIGGKAKAAVTALIQVFNGSDENLRISAASALGMIGPDAKDAIPILIKELDVMHEARQDVAALALGKIGPEAKAAIPSIVKMAKNRDYKYARRDAIYALGRFGSEAREAVPALLETLKDQDEWVQTLAAEALSRIDPTTEGWRPVLTEKLSNKEKLSRLVDGSLLDDGPAEGRFPLTDAKLQRLVAARGLWQEEEHRKAALAVILEALDDRDISMVMRALEYLAELEPGAKSGVPSAKTLQKTIQRWPRDIRPHIARLVWRIAPPE